MSQSFSYRHDRPDELCPHLGQITGDHRREPPVEFPSFENQCLALDAGELITLGDQATYCLAAHHRHCPRFRRAANPDTQPAEFVPLHRLAEDAWATFSAGNQPGESGAEMAFEPLLGAEEDRRSARRRWAWIGAALVFTSVFLCGGMIASYTGWQWIARNLPARAVNEGSVDTVAAAPTPAVFVVHTATPDPALGGSAVTDPAMTDPAMTGSAMTGPTVPVIVLPPAGGDSTQGFPAAVTPTPIVLELTLPQPVDGVGDPELVNATPLLNIDIPIPTRRPTPVFDLPTSTPLAEMLQSPTATPTPVPLGTPIVLFAAEQPGLERGLCTLVHWNVVNVREVYYEDLPVSGQGEREVCIDKEDRVLELRVFFGDGASQLYTTTVSYLAPTPTITPTPSFTPEPVYTPTWTPQPPTATPTPNVRYGVVLTPSASSNATCSAGQQCEVGLLMTNSGDATDTLILMLVQGGAFPAQLCRPDGVCAGNDLSIAGVGSGNTAYVVLRVDVLANADAQSTSYSLLAFSGGSGRSIVSQQVTIGVTVP